MSFAFLAPISCPSLCLDDGILVATLVVRRQTVTVFDFERVLWGVDDYPNKSVLSAVPLVGDGAYESFY